MDEEEFFELLKKFVVLFAAVTTDQEEMVHGLLCVHAGAYQECPGADECELLQLALAVYKYVSDEIKAELDSALTEDTSRLN